MQQMQRIITVIPLTLQLKPMEKRRDFMLRVKLVDGKFNPVVVVRLQVARQGERHEGPRGFEGPPGFRGEQSHGFPGGNFPPIQTPTDIMRKWVAS